MATKRERGRAGKGRGRAGEGRGRAGRGSAGERAGSGGAAAPKLGPPSVDALDAVNKALWNFIVHNAEGLGWNRASPDCQMVELYCNRHGIPWAPDGIANVGLIVKANIEEWQKGLKDVPEDEWCPIEWQVLTDIYTKIRERVVARITAEDKMRFNVAVAGHVATTGTRDMIEATQMVTMGRVLDHKGVKDALEESNGIREIGESYLSVVDADIDLWALAKLEPMYEPLCEFIKAELFLALAPPAF